MTIVFKWIKPVLLCVFLLCLCKNVLAEQPTSSSAPEPEQQPASSAKPTIDWGAWAEWDNASSAAKSSSTAHPEGANWSQHSMQHSSQDPPKQYGVGIQGTIENKLSELDKSSLLENADGVAVKQNQHQSDVKPPSPKPTKDIKRMMQAIQQMEAEVEKEINDDAEF